MIENKNVWLKFRIKLLLKIYVSLLFITGFECLDSKFYNMCI